MTSPRDTLTKPVGFIAGYTLSSLGRGSDGYIFPHQNRAKILIELFALSEADRSHLLSLEDENARLREALAFYADERNWKDGGFAEAASGHEGMRTFDFSPSTAEQDRGVVARTALKENTHDK